MIRATAKGHRTAGIDITKPVTFRGYSSTGPDTDGIRYESLEPVGGSGIYGVKANGDRTWLGGVATKFWLEQEGAPTAPAIADAPVVATTTAPTAAQPTRASFRDHGDPSTAVFYGRGRTATRVGRLVRITRIGLGVQITDYSTGVLVDHTGCSGKMWLAPAPTALTKPTTEATTEPTYVAILANRTLEQTATTAATGTPEQLAALEAAKLDALTAAAADPDGRFPATVHPLLLTEMMARGLVHAGCISGHGRIYLRQNRRTAKPSTTQAATPLDEPADRTPAPLSGPALTIGEARTAGLLGGRSATDPDDDRIRFDRISADEYVNPDTNVRLIRIDGIWHIQTPGEQPRTAGNRDRVLDNVMPAAHSAVRAIRISRATAAADRAQRLHELRDEETLIDADGNPWHRDTEETLHSLWRSDNHQGPALPLATVDGMVGPMRLPDCEHPNRVEGQPDVCADCGAWQEDGQWMGDAGPIEQPDGQPYDFRPGDMWLDSSLRGDVHPLGVRWLVRADSAGAPELYEPNNGPGHVPAAAARRIRGGMVLLERDGGAPVLDGDGLEVPPAGGVVINDSYRVFMAGRVRAKNCPHYLAKSDARAGFTKCERC